MSIALNDETLRNLPPPDGDDVPTPTEGQAPPPSSSPKPAPLLLKPSVKVCTTWLRFEPLGYGLRTLALLLLYLDSVYPTALPVRWIGTALVMLVLGLSVMLYHSIQLTRSAYSSCTMMEDQLALIPHDPDTVVPISYRCYVHRSIPVLVNGLQALVLVILFIQTISSMHGTGPRPTMDAWIPSFVLMFLMILTWMLPQYAGVFQYRGFPGPSRNNLKLVLHCKWTLGHVLAFIVLGALVYLVGSFDHKVEWNRGSPFLLRLIKGGLEYFGETSDVRLLFSLKRALSYL